MISLLLLGSEIFSATTTCAEDPVRNIHTSNIEESNQSDFYLKLISPTGPSGNTYIHLLCEQGDSQKLSEIFKSLSDSQRISLLALTNKDRNTPLHLAALNGHHRLVVQLLNMGADINAKNKNGDTPLHIATRKGYWAITCALLNHNANTDAPCCLGTPLQAAVQTNNADMVMLLLDHNANIDAPGKDGRTPLQIAVKNNNTDILKLLLEHLAKIHVPGRDLYTVINTCPSGCHTTLLGCAVLGDKLDVIKLLLSYQARIDGPYGYSPLELANEYKNDDMVKLLLLHSVADSPNIEFYNSLQEAIKNHNIDMVQSLLHNNPNIVVIEPLVLYSKLLHGPCGLTAILRERAN